ncbi:hypothetical protein Vretimale_10667 [Volvox reticuliferus]|uniref:RanBD1 domain-containing protein n=1 Tax=Volvox reticuliferus TaxID=1737510 RepID=A0A8J4GGE1_9CHLO|nr:hypothetical protein Vretifemale_13925 [Volvox reticuliferus]GIM06342.1 hypothetical protein Vretimale_10667 [Volvox reticuliferus]
MAPKRRASSEALPASKERRSGSEPRDRLASTLTSLNEQFASWVAFNKDSSAHLLWIDGVRDYVHHASKVLDECKAFLPPENVSALQQVVTDSTTQGWRSGHQSIKAKTETASKEDRAVEFVRLVGGLNRQFAKWVTISNETSLRMWWLEAARDYLKYANKLLTDFSDVFSDEPDSKPLFGTAKVAASTPAEPEMECRVPSFSSLPGTAPVGFGAFGTPGPNAGSGLAGLFGAPASKPASNSKGTAPATGFLAPAAAAASTGGASSTYVFGSLATTGVSTGTAAGIGGSTGVTPTTHSGGFGGFGFAVPASSAPAAAQAAASTKDAPAAATVATGFVFPPVLATAGASKDATAGATDAGTAGSIKVAAGDKSEPANAAAGTKAFGFTLTLPTSSTPVLIKADTAGNDEVAAVQPLRAFTTANFAATATTAVVTPEDATARAAEAGNVRDSKGLVGDKPAAAAAASEPANAGADGASTTSVAAAASSGLPKFGAFPKTEPTTAPVPATEEPAQPMTVGFGVGSSDNARAPASKLFVFGGPSAASSSAAAASSTAPAITSGFIFGAQPSAASSASAGAGNLAGAIFGSGAAVGGSTAPSFGVAVKDAAGVGTGTTTIGSAATAAAAFGSAASSNAPLGSFFGAAAPAGGSGTAPAIGGFSFGGSATSFSVNPNPAAAATAAEDADDNEPEPEQDEYAKEPGGVKPDETVDVLFREKARLQVPLKGPDGKLSGWQSLGVGTLSIRKAKTDTAKPFIALYMDNGACLYRAYLYKTMKLVVSDKQKSVAFSAVWGIKDAVPAMNPALFQLKAGKNREFEKVVLKLQEEMPE